MNMKSWKHEAQLMYWGEHSFKQQTHRDILDIYFWQCLTAVYTVILKRWQEIKMNTKNLPALHNTEGGLALRSRADKFFLHTLQRCDFWEMISSITNAV